MWICYFIKFLHLSNKNCKVTSSSAHVTVKVQLKDEKETIVFWEKILTKLYFNSSEIYLVNDNQKYIATPTYNLHTNQFNTAFCRFLFLCFFSNFSSLNWFQRNPIRHHNDNVMPLVVRTGCRECFVGIGRQFVHFLRSISLGPNPWLKRLGAYLGA